jgi:hypothetical protein
VGSICKQINKIYENAHNGNKKTIWKHVAVSEVLAKMCMRDHKDLGRRRHEIQKMVNAIGLVAATSGNVQVFKWALWNNFYIEDLCMQYDVFHQVANNGHIEILEWADMKDMHWYRQEMLDDAAARTDLDVLLFLLKKKPREFNLRFTTMCVTNGYTEVLEWWKEMEIVELFRVAVQSPQRMVRMLDCMYDIGYQQASSDLKEILELLIVHWAASGGMIDVLEWARDRGMHDDAESCLHAAWHGHLHVLKWLREDGATWDSRVISCAEEEGYNHVVEWAQENGCPEP